METAINPETDNGQVQEATRSKRRKSVQPRYNEEDYQLFDSDSDNPDDDPEFKPNKKTRSSAKAATKQKRPLSDYATFCKEHRPKMKEEFPDLTASQLKDCLQSLWKEMTPAARATFSTDANNGNQMEEDLSASDSAVYTAFCCEWGSCDYQFEVVDECAEHINEQHLQPLCRPGTDVMIAPTACRWYGCLRRNRCSLPFILFKRLYRHINEEHVLVAKTLRTHELSQNFVQQQKDA